MKQITPWTRDTRVVDEIVLAYIEWREESAAVWDAYDRWTCPPSEDTRPADVAYRAALDREEAAARSYARLIELARNRPDIAGDVAALRRATD